MSFDKIVDYISPQKKRQPSNEDESTLGKELVTLFGKSAIIADRSENGKEEVEEGMLDSPNNWNYMRDTASSSAPGGVKTSSAEELILNGRSRDITPGECYAWVIRGINGS